MITYTTGDMFTSKMQMLVNPVNTVGIMGKGLAKHFKIRYPTMFTNYKTACDSGLLTVGKLHIFHTDDKWILNFPTKAHWRAKSKVEYIEAGLNRFVEIYKHEQIESIAFPMLGCGLGGLDWVSQVKPLMETYLNDLDIEIEIYVNS
jgi:O-acetyl-ADP-ribose deacetylase (regulator of RNase III)